MKDNMYPVSVIIVTHNSEKVLEDSLDSVLGCNASEVIVVDCGSNDRTQEIVKSRDAVRLVCIGNEGYGRGNNFGVAVATQDYILILNPDVLIRETDLENLFGFCSRLLKPAIVAPKMFHRNGNTKVFRKDSRFAGEKVSVKKVCGAAMMIPRTLFNQLKGFDPNIFLYFEEIDLCIRAKRIGADVLVCGFAEVEHFKAGSTPSSPKYEHIRGWHDGWSKLYFESKCAETSSLRFIVTAKVLLQTCVKILTKGLSKDLVGQRRERNKLLGMKAFLRGEQAFDSDGKARFTD